MKNYLVPKKQSTHIFRKDIQVSAGSGVRFAVYRAALIASLGLCSADFAFSQLTGVLFLSDVSPISATNGSGPVEKDRSNGGRARGDGRVITLNGKTYSKGLGVNARSEIRYNLGGACSTFTASVGVDDEVGGRGSVVFRVLVDGSRVFDSGLMRGNTATQSVSVGLTGKQELTLTVTDAGDGSAYDRADWADAKVSCNQQTPGPGPNPNPGALTPSQPLVINGRQQVLIKGVSITNPNGPCIDVRGNSQNVTIENSTLGPCKGVGVNVSSSKAIVIRNVHIHDTTDNAVTLYSVDGADITDNRIENVQTGVYALESNKVNVSFNNFLNVRGPMPRGQFVQFDKVKGPGNRIKCNVGQNITGQSYPEDAISLYQTYGDAADPVQVIGNKIKGGGPSTSGGGIMLGDSGGSHQVAKDNILVDPGQYGIAISSGTNLTITGNSVYARQQPFTNVGIYVWNQYSSPCSSATVQTNSVNWTNNDGDPNPGWNAGNCGTVSGWANNNMNAAISDTVFYQPIAACQR